VGVSLAWAIGIWLWAIASGIVYYGLAFWFYITALKQTSATLAGLFLNLIPVFGVRGARKPATAREVK
jgi:drug/metabolite transporter (DMT)-like permease